MTLLRFKFGHCAFGTQCLDYCALLSISNSLCIDWNDGKLSILCDFQEVPAGLKGPGNRRAPPFCARGIIVFSSSHWALARTLLYCERWRPAVSLGVVYKCHDGHSKSDINRQLETSQIYHLVRLASSHRTPVSLSLRSQNLNWSVVLVVHENLT